MSSPGRSRRSWQAAQILALTIFLAFAAQAAELAIHTFSCKNCHIASLSVSQLGAGNVCLSCHDTQQNFPLSDTSIGMTDWAFTAVDASNAFGNNQQSLVGRGQTSHNWGAPDTEPRAGAAAPERSLYPQFYSRSGASQGKVTCSRCHNPHADRANPRMLVMGPGSAQQMCLACHAPWDRGSGHSNVTHPVDIHYADAVIAEAGKYTAPPPDASVVPDIYPGVVLFDGMILCGTCHVVHFSDSDINTLDLPGNFADLTMHGGDGKLLRGNGPGRTDKSSLCRSCHTYGAHGDGTGETVGCLVCHSGHANDDLADPNYFMLRKNEATTATFGTVPNLDYSDPAVLDAGQKHTFWNDRTDGTANGYCERCHGDARTIGAGAGSYHVAAAICTDCHKHDTADGAFVASCNSCHGMPPVDADTLVWNPVQGTGSVSAGAHEKHVGTYGYGCDACHAQSVGNGPTHNNGALAVTMGFSLFDGSSQGGSYDGQATTQYDATATNPATTVTKTGTQTCANLYCHSDGRSLSNATIFPVENESPPWNATSPGCGGCHEYPPPNDSHFTHISRGFSCQHCHALTTTNGTTIANTTRHLNKTYDLNPGGTFTYQSITYDVNFSYAFSSLFDNAGSAAGGSCSTVTCHDRMGFKPNQTVYWRYATLNSSAAVNQSCLPNYTVDLTVTNALGIPPYTCTVKWGDGTAAETVPCSQEDGTPIPLSHDYTSKVSTIIQWFAWDSEGTPSAFPSPREQPAFVCNDPPAPSFSLINGGGAGADVILVDAATDNDASVPSHAGPGKLKVDWGGWEYNGAPTKAVSEYTVNYGTGAPSPSQHPFRYSSSGDTTVFVAVQDNAGEWRCSDRIVYRVQTGSVEFIQNFGQPAAYLCNSLINATPNSPFVP